MDDKTIVLDNPPQHVDCRLMSLRTQIRRRRLRDVLFAYFGCLLVVCSLLILVALFGQLLIDGTKRLTGSHLVKANGYAPGIRDIVGAVRTDRDAVESVPKLYLPDVRLLPDRDTRSSAAQLAGHSVLVHAESFTAGATEVVPEQIEATESELPARFSSSRIHGVLEIAGEHWTLKPTPVPLRLPDDGGAASWEEHEAVAVTLGVSKSLPLKVKRIEPLVRQSFLQSMPSRDAHRAGVKSALVGSLLVIFVTMVFAVPLGVAAGVWLEEYGGKNWLTALIEINIANLAGVPSIVWGLMALGILVYYFDLGRSILTAGITLGLLVLPIVITATREAIRAIPIHVREASYACGASKWQTMRYHILPYSFGGILTGSIIGLSRAIGETAPLITIGALTYVAFLPDFSLTSPLSWLKSGFTVLPIQMFNWISRPDLAFHENAAAAGVLLLVMTLSLNAVAIGLRYRVRKSVKW